MIPWASNAEESLLSWVSASKPQNESRQPTTIGAKERGTSTKIDINDKDGLTKAMNAMKPGDFIEVQGNGGPMTVGVPLLEGDIVQPIDPTRRPQEGDSWLD